MKHPVYGSFGVISISAAPQNEEANRLTELEDAAADRLLAWWEWPELWLRRHPRFYGAFLFGVAVTIGALVMAGGRW